MGHLFKLILITALIGCVQAPKNSTTFDQSEIDIPDDKSSIIVLYRKMVPPVMYSVSATINGKPFVKLPNNSFSWVKVTPGDYKLNISWPILAATPSEKKDLTIEAGKYYFLEFGGSTSIAFYGVGAAGYNTHSLEVLDYKQGIKIVKDCCKYIPSKF